MRNQAFRAHLRLSQKQVNEAKKNCLGASVGTVWEIQHTGLTRRSLINAKSTVHQVDFITNVGRLLRRRNASRFPWVIDTIFGDMICIGAVALTR